MTDRVSEKRPYPQTANPDALDFLVDAVREEDPEQVRLRLHRMVYEAVTHPVRQQWEAEASLNYQYVENDFYTDEELAEFRQRGQPPTKRNEIAPILERVAGQFIQTRQAATFLGRNTPADDQAGTIAQDYLRWNDQYNLYEFEEQEQSWDALVGGVGWVKSWVKRNELGQEIETKRSRNPFTIFPDPYHLRYNPNEDAKYICEGAWMDLEDCIALVPDKEDDLRQMVHGLNYGNIYAGLNVAGSLKNEVYTAQSMAVYIDRVRKRVRPFEVWYKRKVKLYHLFRPDGVVAIPVPFDHKTARKIVKELGGEVYAEASWHDRMYVGIILADLVLHHDVSPHQTNLFPYFPFYGGRRKNGAPLPIASRLVPINESINKRESKSLALMTNRQIIAEKNAIEDPEEAQSEHAKPDGYIEVKEGALQNQRVMFRDNLDIGQAQLALLQEDKDAIRRVSGHGNESMGMPSEVRSGAGIARKQMMSNLIVMPMQNNLRHTRYLKARLSFEYMKQYMTEEQSFQITDDPNVPRTVQVTKGHIKAIQEFTYDLVITEMKDYETVREQQVEMLLNALPALAKLGPGMVKLGIQLTELRDKEGLQKLVDQQSAPPPNQPKISITATWADLTPEVQAYIAMTEWQAPDLAKMILDKKDDPAFRQRLKSDQIQTLIKEGTRASIERGRVDVEAMGTAIEGRMRLREFDQQAQAAPEQPDPTAQEETSL